MVFEMVETNRQGTVIKVVGVGGAGGNAVAHMINRGVQGVEFVCANTDAQVLAKSRAHTVIQIGRNGLGAGGKPEAGRAAAESERERIADALRGANMVFITAGMGGGTGTGAGPVVAQIAKEMGVLTVGVVSKPFVFEGGKRMRVAEEGLEQLAANVDSLIVILNEKLQDVMGEDASMEDCFKAADDVLHNAVAGIAEIINVEGNVNVDFEDVKTIMSEQGRAMMGTAVASGPERARLAAEQAIASPLLEGVDLSAAKGVLINVTASRSLKLKEVNQVMSHIRQHIDDAHARIIYGQAYDDSMGEDLRVTVIATGLSKVAMSRRETASMRVVRTGTDEMPVYEAPQSLDMPSVFRTRRSEASSRIQALQDSGMDQLDIPAFLRRQAD